MTDLTPDALRAKLVADDAFTEATAGGMRLLVKKITAADFVAFQRPLLELRSGGKPPTATHRTAASLESYAALVRAAAYTVDGTPLFAEWSDEEMHKLDAALWSELAATCLEHSGIAAADVEEAEKNSEATAD